MDLGHAETFDGLALEIELDYNRCFVSHNPAVMSRLDRDHLRLALSTPGLTVLVLDVNPALSKEPDARVHAQLGTNDGFQVGGPKRNPGG